MTFLPRMAVAATAAIKPSPLCLPPTLNTVFRKLRRGINRSSMNNLMAFMADRNSIINIKSQFRKLREWLDMVSLKELSPISAFLAGVIISHKNSLSPDCQTIPQNSPITIKACAPLPMSRFISTEKFRSVFSSAGAGAELRSAICGCEYFLAPQAGFNRRGITNRPTSLRAVLRILRPVKRSLKNLTTNNARLLNGSFLHDNTSAFRDINSDYCGVKVQRWEKLTGQKRQRVSD